MSSPQRFIDRLIEFREDTQNEINKIMDFRRPNNTFARNEDPQSGSHPASARRDRSPEQRAMPENIVHTVVY